MSLNCNFDSCHFLFWMNDSIRMYFKSLKWNYTSVSIKITKYQGVKNFTLVAHMGRNATFHAVLCSYTWTMHITLCAVGLQWHKITGNALSIPAAACSQQLLRRNNLLFIFFLVFSPHDMNAFDTDFIVDNIVTHVQGFLNGILMNIHWETECKMWRNLD